MRIDDKSKSFANPRKINNTANENYSKNIVSGNVHPLSFKIQHQLQTNNLTENIILT